MTIRSRLVWCQAVRMVPGSWCVPKWLVWCCPRRLKWSQVVGVVWTQA
ncbi:hypothetical protein AVEN_106741-1, partial [Araneus ventricosus]